MATSLGSVPGEAVDVVVAPVVDVVRIVVREGATPRPHGPNPAPAVPSDDDEPPRSKI
jgi:hypothetical protein